MSPPHPPLPQRDGLAPTQIALRELMILTRCYCDGEHPRLGHNCSFRPDVETLVANIGAALKICEDELASGGTDPWSHPSPLAGAIHATLLGLPLPDDSPPWSNEEAPGTG